MAKRSIYFDNTNFSLVMFFITITKRAFLTIAYDSEMGKVFSPRKAFTNSSYFQFLRLNENEQWKEMRQGTLLLKDSAGKIYLNVSLIYNLP